MLYQPAKYSSDIAIKMTDKFGGIFIKMDRVIAAPTPGSGLTLYQNLNLFLRLDSSRTIENDLRLELKDEGDVHVIQYDSLTAYKLLFSI